jgi:hypothetical protein
MLILGYKFDMEMDMDNPFERSGVIDSRDVLEYLDELGTELQTLKEDNPAEDDEEVAELELKLSKLKEFSEECEGYNSDWVHGAQLIPSDYFTEYAKELVEDIGDIPRDLPHYIAIDWDATAENLKVDYTTVEYDGTEYYLLNT